MDGPFVFTLSAPVTTPEIDPQDPFQNETEFHAYQPDYGHILPQIRLPGCQIPRLPETHERSRIRRYYNIVGGFMTGHFLLSNVLGAAILLLFEGIIMMLDTAASGGELPENYSEMLQSFVNSSSAMLSISVLIYGLCNVLVAVMGCKATKIPLPNLFRTKNFSPVLAIGYIGIALLAQTAMGHLADWMTNMFSGVGVTLFEADFGTPATVRENALSFVYSVIVAPITEELMMRGFVLKNLSRANQRFGIVMSAFLFGIWHENLAQFLLAFTVGCFLGYIVIKHDSLVPAIICHMAVNFFAEMYSFSDTFGLDWLIYALNVLYLLLMFIGLGMLVYLIAAERFPRTTPAQAERGLRIGLTSPLLLLVIVCHLGASVIYIMQASGVIQM